MDASDVGMRTATGTVGVGGPVVPELGGIRVTAAWVAVSVGGGVRLAVGDAEELSVCVGRVAAVLQARISGVKRVATTIPEIFK